MTKKEQVRRYKEVLEKVFAVCKTTGWYVHLENEDPEGKFAIFHVSKDFQSTHITAVIDVKINEGIQYSVQHTSFHSYGTESLLGALKIKFQELDWLEKPSSKKMQESPKALQIVSTLLRNFDRAVRQLKRRYDERPPILMNDEYDVQDFLHSLLRGYFGDIRAEEYTPSYAGSASRLDFLIKEEKIVIEAKYATAKLKLRDIGNQLIIDIKRYQSHPDCSYLFCLVYDPDGNIHNPEGLEKDLSKIHDKLDVRVFVVPR